MLPMTKTSGHGTDLHPQQMAIGNENRTQRWIELHSDAIVWVMKKPTGIEVGTILFRIRVRAIIIITTYCPDTQWSINM